MLVFQVPLSILCLSEYVLLVFIFSIYAYLINFSHIIYVYFNTNLVSCCVWKVTFT